MYSSDYHFYEQQLIDSRFVNQIFLPKAEYSKVIREFNLNMSSEDRDKLIVTKPIGDYYYTIINRGFNDYVVVDKYSIDSVVTQDYVEDE